MTSISYFKEINSRGNSKNESQCIYYFEVKMTKKEHLRELIRYIEIDDKCRSFKCDKSNDQSSFMKDQEDYNVTNGDFLNDTDSISKLEFEIIWVNINYQKKS